MRFRDRLFIIVGAIPSAEFLAQLPVSVNTLRNSVDTTGLGFPFQSTVKGSHNLHISVNQPFLKVQRLLRQMKTSNLMVMRKLQHQVVCTSRITKPGDCVSLCTVQILSPN